MLNSASANNDACDMVLTIQIEVLPHNAFINIKFLIVTGSSVTRSYAEINKTQTFGKKKKTYRNALISAAKKLTVKIRAF